MRVITIGTQKYRWPTSDIIVVLPAANIPQSSSRCDASAKFRLTVSLTPFYAPTHSFTHSLLLGFWGIQGSDKSLNVGENGRKLACRYAWLLLGWRIFVPSIQVARTNSKLHLTLD